MNQHQVPDETLSSPARQHRTTRWMILLTAILTLFLLGLGNVVSSTGSGLGCADHWPTCNGKWIPDFTNKHVVIEFSHRMVAGIVGILTLFLTIGTWTLKKTGAYRTSIRNLSITAFLLLSIQVVLGGVAVKMELPPGIVILHNGFSMAFFAGLIFLLVRFYQMDQLLYAPDPDEEDSTPSSSTPGILLVMTTLLIFLQILLGAYVRHSGARLGCPDFPLCQGQWFPPFEKTAIIHYAHRVTGGIVAVCIGVLTYRILRTNLPRFPKALAIFGSLLVIFQIMLGVLTVLSSSVVLWSTLHVLTAALLLAIFTTLTALVYPVKPADVQPAFQK